MQAPKLRADPRSMRVSDQLRKCVVFFGYPDETPGQGGIHCIGTGFLLGKGPVGYLVTNVHVAQILGSDSFLVRVNRKDGAAESLVVDGAQWVYHPDTTVDVAIIPFFIDILKYDCIYMNADTVAFKPEEFDAINIGVGNFTYTFGLFRLLSGEKRNLPIVHTGHIAMIPGDERIPMVDWTDPKKQRRVLVEGYLIGAQTLSGLSGSPVFVRPEININHELASRPLDNNHPMSSKMKPVVASPLDTVRLLGIWQGAWEAKPDDVLAVETGREVRVPVGMGIVVPYQRILEILEVPKVKAHREDIIAHYLPPAAQLDSATPSTVAASVSDANPTHREDFTSLLSAAVKKPAPKD